MTFYKIKWIVAVVCFIIIYDLNHTFKIYKLYRHAVWRGVAETAKSQHGL